MLLLNIGWLIINITITIDKIELKNTSIEKKLIENVVIENIDETHDEISGLSHFLGFVDQEIPVRLTGFLKVSYFGSLGGPVSLTGVSYWVS